MRPGLSPAPARNAARAAKLGLSLAGFTTALGTGVRAELAQRTAADALGAATKAGIGLYHGVEGAEGLMRHVGEGRFVLHLKSEGLGADQLEGRLTLARERMRAMRPFAIMIEGVHLCSAEGQALWA